MWIPIIEKKLEVPGGQTIAKEIVVDIPEAQMSGQYRILISGSLVAEGQSKWTRLTINQMYSDAFPTGVIATSSIALIGKRRSTSPDCISSEIDLKNSIGIVANAEKPRGDGLYLGGNIIAKNQDNLDVAQDVSFYIDCMVSSEIAGSGFHTAMWRSTYHTRRTEPFFSYGFDGRGAFQTNSNEPIQKFTIHAGFDAQRVEYLTYRVYRLHGDLALRAPR